MSVWGAVVGGLVGTLVLTSLLRAASELGLTRMDIPFLLGTAFSEHRVHAKAIGYGVHAAFGLLFALAYWAVFAVVDESGWLVGALLGLLHGVFASTTLVNVLLPLVHPRMASPLTAAGDAPLLESPGFLMLNYGHATPAVTLLGHVAYGAVVGGFVSLAS